MKSCYEFPHLVNLKLMTRYLIGQCYCCWVKGCWSDCWLRLWQQVAILHPPLQRTSVRLSKTALIEGLPTSKYVKCFFRFSVEPAVRVRVGLPPVHHQVLHSRTQEYPASLEPPPESLGPPPAESHLLVSDLECILLLRQDLPLERRRQQA